MVLVDEADGLVTVNVTIFQGLLLVKPLHVKTIWARCF